MDRSLRSLLGWYSQTHSYGDIVANPKPIRTVAICTNPRCNGPREEFLKGHHGEGWRRDVGRGAVACPHCTYSLYWSKSPRAEPPPMGVRLRRCPTCKARVQPLLNKEGAWYYQCESCRHLCSDGAALGE